MSETNAMRINGLSNTFWVVTRPNRVSELSDICCACTFRQLMKRTRGGLHEKEIIGIFADEAEARQVGLKLLGRNIVRTSDSIIVEVGVNVLMTPTRRNMTARVLARAALEAVANAVRKAEEEGFRHRLGNQVTMGVGEVGLQNHLTLFG
jgi:CO dehydrogenase nickel-insertion accessory protein CooC1